MPPPEWNIFEDNLLIEGGVADLVRRAFAGERMKIPPIWYDVRELRSVHLTTGRRIAVGPDLSTGPAAWSVPVAGCADGRSPRVMFP